MPPANQNLLKEAMALYAAGRHAAALQAFERIRVLQPSCWEAHHYAGLALLLTQKYREALPLLRKAQSLSPTRTDSAVALALSLLSLGEAVEAEALLRPLAAKWSKAADVHDTLGLTLRALGRYEDAITAHEIATKQAPKVPGYWVNLGQARLKIRRLSEAQAAFEKARQLDPKNAAALSGSAQCLYKLHRLGEAVDCYRKSLAINPRQPGVMSNMLMPMHSLDGVTRERLFEEHRNYGRLVGGPVRTLPLRAVGSVERLRVGLLSEDFHAHSVAFFLKPLLRGAEKNGIELVFYSDGLVNDAVTAELRRHAAVWRCTAGQMPQVIEHAMLADKLDALIDLAGHTGASRLELLARRVAPAQITYLGYPDTTGVPAMDYRFVDPISDPAPEADALATERLVRFSDCAWCYEPPSVPTSPERRAGEDFVFCSFNNFSKVTDTVLANWGLLLAEVPGAKLLLKSIGLDEPAVAENLKRRMQQAGLPLERVEVRGMTSSTEEHLALYREADVALDTFPYNGTTTTCEALWMGVPVVTLVGDRHVSRVGASLLKAVGCQSWIASSWDEYRAVAKRLVLDNSADVLRGASLRDAISGSLLMDGPRQADFFWMGVRKCAGAK